jgi:CheY-like chemotaxis protein
VSSPPPPSPTGSGLGLWIAKGITHIHGGAIGVECQEIGHGSLFYAEFPLVDGLISPSAVSRHQNHCNANDEMRPFEEPASDDLSRFWRWSDPRNNIDRTNLITPRPRGKFFNQKVSNFQTCSSKPPEESIKSSSHLEPSNSVTNLIFPSPTVNTPQHYSALGVEEPTPSSSSSLHSRPPLRILIVDDVKSIRRLLDRALTNQGHHCHVACDGQECLDLIKQHSLSMISSNLPSSSSPLPHSLLDVHLPQSSSSASSSLLPPLSSSSSLSSSHLPICFYDLILMDSEMPIMNGPLATKTIRSLYSSDQLIILGVTGNVLPEDVDMFLNHGVDAVLGKPMNLEMMWREYDRLVLEKKERKKRKVKKITLPLEQGSHEQYV